MTSIAPYYKNIVKSDINNIKFIDKTKSSIKENNDINNIKEKDERQTTDPNETMGRYLLYIGGETKPSTPAHLEQGQMLTPRGKLFNRHTTYFARGDLNWSEFGDYMKEKFPNIENVDINVFGCSTGEEPYTLAMILKKIYGDSPFKIKAMDITEDIIIKNNLNKTEGVIIDSYDFETICKSLNLNGQDINHFFERDEGRRLILRKNITDCVQFSKANILTDINKINSEKPSLIFCRNMWPYIDSKEYESFAQKLYDKLAPGSVVVVGEYDLNGERDKDYLPKFPQFLVQSGFKSIFRCHSKERKQLVKKENLPFVFEKK